MAAASGSVTGGREDAWSEGATSALIDAWGERYLEVGRGSLRQKQWQEVADAVTSRDGYTKTPKSDSQCKNRIDTLKKKYKLERSKPYPSNWPFYSRIDCLLGPLFSSPLQPPASSNPHPPRKRHRPSISPPLQQPLQQADSASSSDGFPPDTTVPRPPPSSANGIWPVASTAGHKGVKVVVEAIKKLGEVYERTETAKLRREAEMEKRKIAFLGEIDEKRVQFFANTQVALARAGTGSNGARQQRATRQGTTNGGHNAVR